MAEKQSLDKITDALRERAQQIFVDNAGLMRAAASSICKSAAERQEIKDVLQDVCLRAAEKLPGVKYPKAYLRQASINAMLTRCKALSDERARLAIPNQADDNNLRQDRSVPGRQRKVVDADEIESQQAGPLETLDLFWKMETVRTAISRLPDAQRNVITSLYWAEMTLKQIADHAGYSYQNVQHIRNLALESLREDFGEKYILQLSD